MIAVATPMQTQRGILPGGPDERVDAEGEAAGDDGDCATFDILSNLLFSRNRPRQRSDGGGCVVGTLTQGIDLDGDAFDGLSHALGDGVGC